MRLDCVRGEKMEDIVKELAKLNQKDCFDIVTIILPILLSFIIIIQNIVYNKRTTALQKMIHNREWAQQHQDNILLLYNTYYEFIDVIYSSGFNDYVRSGNVNMALGWMNSIQLLKTNILRRKDLAKLLFKKKNENLYNIIKNCFEQEIKIIDKYITYLSSGKLFIISENAWNTVCQTVSAAKHNYQWLLQNSNAYDNFMKLCYSEEMMEIEKLLKENEKLHSYENFDKYFEEFFAVEKLS